MPFTPSHVAAVLPLLTKKRKWISETGIVVGAMVPDFEYFFRMKMQSDISHSWLGMLLFNLPIGILLCYLYHNSVRDSLIHNLPNFLRHRLFQFTNWSWNKHFKKEWKAILFSLVLGSFTHLIWDGFTHYYGMFVQLLGYESTRIGEIKLYRVLQHASTVGGGVLMLFYLFKMKVNKKIKAVPHWRYWVSFVLITLIVFSVKGLNGNGYSLDQYGNIIVALISSILIALILSPAFIPSQKK